MILPVIMAGGSGSRLWPLSRQLFPKQFLTLQGELSMLQTTISRLSDIPHQKPLIICNEEHRFIVAEQLRETKSASSQIMLEPVSRNTAPAIALAALHALETGQDPILLILPADHIIKNNQAFITAINHATVAANNDKLVTFGVVPHTAETGYGYLKVESTSDDSPPYKNVSQFIEKPDRVTAQHYLQQGNYFWNSGMFMFKASVFLNELKQSRPDIYHACEAAMINTSADLDFIRVDKEAFKQCPAESVDYAVMEKTEKTVVVPLDAGWNDIGNWSTLWDIEEKDNDGNVCHGDVINLDSSDCYINAQEKLVATIGLNDIVVIETKDAVLVSKKSSVQQVKDVVETLKSQQRSEATLHREVYRPWGKYDSLDKGERFKVKRITVKPGARLSTQMHHHRAEHWIVVSGTAKVSNADTEIILTENQSTYIPIGSKHSLENPGMVDLQLIEVQSGCYLEEDDIIRFDDKYGRNKP